jgi:hypothetical protein
MVVGAAEDDDPPRRGRRCAAAANSGAAGSTRSYLIREAIRRLLRAETSSDRRPRPLGRSRHTNTSQRVDELLEDGFGR